MLAVVTGATGCIGRNLVDVLKAEGWRIRAWKRAEVDLHNPHAVLRAMPRRPAAVFHCAANLSHHKIDAGEQWRDNVLATRNLVAASTAKKAGRFVLVSTGAVTGNNLSGYVATKRQAELEAEGHTIVRLPIVIGRYDRRNYAQLFRMPLPVAFPGSGEFCDARDAARAIFSAKDSCEVGGHVTTWLDLFQRIARLTGRRPPTHAARRWALLAYAYATAWQRRPLLTPDLVRLFDCGASGQPPGPHTIDDMLEDCWQWLTTGC